ncbi:MAG: hypothetical protein LBS21_09695 [Clostridiales bacterium]|jgi:hypothetical protein|nr:hypothetical protein [Clostridiales bacterium]
MKRKRIKRIFTGFVLLIMTALPFSQTVFANSAEPPALTILVSFPADDLELSIRFANGSVTEAVQLKKEQKAWEVYYRFFYSMNGSQRESLEGAVLVAKSSEKSFECPMPEASFNTFNNLLTLNVESESVSSGQSLFRAFLLIAMRVVLTLLIEGFIFHLFGYRSAASWWVFFAANLLTQGALNIAISGPNLSSYWFIGFVLFEIIIFIAEALIFALAVKERKKSRAVLYTLTANLFSLVLGGALISYLPV